MVEKLKKLGKAIKCKNKTILRNQSALTLFAQAHVSIGLFGKGLQIFLEMKCHFFQHAWTCNLHRYTQIRDGGQGEKG